jgi:DNA helicase HerA-like ATPase
VGGVVREVVSINGATGSGKSTLARELVADKYRAVLVDPADDAAWRKVGFRRVRDLPELSRAIAASWRNGFRLALVPPAHLCAEALDGVSLLLCAYQEKLYNGRDLGGVSLVVDEMAECYSNAHVMRSDLRGFRRVILQGRHFGISVYGVTQRPADVAAQFRDNCDRAFYFQLYDATSRDRVVARLGKEHERAYRSLAQFEYLAEVRGAISKGRTRKK